MSSGVLVAVGAIEFEAGLLTALEGPSFHVVRRCVDVADLLAAAATHQAQVAVVSAHLRNLDRDVVARLRQENVAVVGATAEASSADEAALRRLGIESLVFADDVATLREVLTEAMNDPAASSIADAWMSVTPPPDGQALDGKEPRRRGQVIAVWGGSGAPGRSVLALGLSAELARLRQATLLIDADVFGGAVAPMLGMLDESSGLLAAARAANVGALDAESLARHARRVNPALRVLTGLPRADRWTEVKPALLRHVIDIARSVCAFTVIDCGFSVEVDEEISYDVAAPRRNGATLEALENADTVVVVGGADPISLGRLIRALHELSQVVPSATPYVVINRVRDTLGWTESEIVDTVARVSGVARVRTLPDDRQACDKALVHGRTLTECAAEGKVTKALRALAADLAGIPEAAGRRRRLARR